MGKPGKKAGAGKLPPTNVKRRVDTNDTHLRDQRTVKRLKMYTSKIKRDEKGKIIEGSVLKASDKLEKSMARVAPDRRWFGNTRVIGQEALQKYRTEMNAKMKDPYSVVIKQSKLPLSLLEEPKNAHSNALEAVSTHNEVRLDEDLKQRKRVRLTSQTMEELVDRAFDRQDTYGVGAKDRQRMQEVDLTGNMHGKEVDRDDATNNRKLFKKGQSNRIWNELYKVIDSSDVLIYVIDARDPMGTRSPFLEEYMKTEKKYKHLIFVLNKCDLVPLWATARWLQILSKDAPTIAFHASVEHPFGKGNLISLLRQFCRLHNVTHRGSKRTKTPISVGVVGYPNVGKSAIINTLRRKSVCKVAPIPGETKVWQYVALTKSIFMIDCPGVVYDKENNNDVQAILKGVVRVERLGNTDKDEAVATVLEIVKKRDIKNTYGITEWTSPDDFLYQLARNRGKLRQGGVPDSDMAARSMLYDWQRGKLPWFNAPPFESNQQYRDAKLAPESQLLKTIEHYTNFNIVDERIVTAAEEPREAEEIEKDSSDAESVPRSRANSRKMKRSREGSVDSSSKQNVPANDTEDVADEEVAWEQFLNATRHKRKIRK